MKAKIADFWRRNSWEVIVIFFCIVLFSVGVSRKEGYHMDELISFEFANAEYNPWIVPTQPQGRLQKFIYNEIDGATFGETLGNLKDTIVDVLSNKGNSKLLSYKADVYEEPVWIAEERFDEYMTIEGKDAFNYLSVYFNVKDDNHPPLHFMALHTISSFWGNKIAPFIGCVINIFAVAGTMILLINIGRTLAMMLGFAKNSRLTGILAALFYGLSSGALSTILLIRMYGMLTLFCVALFYIHLKKWKDLKFQTGNKGMIAVTVLGFWTQYFFLFYCILLALTTAVLLARKRLFKELIGYIRSMVIAAVIGVIVFPFAVSDVLSSGRGVEAVNNLLAGFGGMTARLVAFGDILAKRTSLVSFVIVLLILLVAGGFKYLKKRDVYLWILVVPVFGYFLLASRMSPYFVDRYIMAVFPFIALIGVVLLMTLVQTVEDKWGRPQIGYAVAGLLMGLQVWSLCNYDGAYLYQGYDEQKVLAETYQDTACICVYEGSGYYENLIEFMYYDKTLLTTMQELENRQDVASVKELDSVVVLAKNVVNWESLSALMYEKYGFELQEELLQEGVHGDRIGLFTKQR